MTPEEFIRRQTVLSPPPLVPEITLHLATEVTPLWRATQARLHDLNLPPPYWAFAWPGGQALARHLLDHPGLVAGQRVLDFASGSGLVAIAAARAGAAQVTAADIDPFAAAAIALNARINGVNPTISTSDAIDRPGQWDAVLAGDICYERPMTQRAIPWLRGLADRGIAVLLVDPGRAYLPADGLTELARYRVPTSLELEDSRVRETVIWRLE
ncbi:MAG: class I SAM-dependent methyltransferase [Dongiaceae bacterium]